MLKYFFFSSRRRHTRLQGDWSSDVCSSDLSSVEIKSIGNVNKLEVEALAASMKKDHTAAIDLMKKATALEEERGAPYRSEERRVGKGCKSEMALNNRKE